MVKFGTTQSLEESNMLQVPAQAEPSQQQSLSIAGETPEPVINQADANAAEVGRIQKASDQSARSRTAAQDLVLKRLRILNKKIQRFRSYQGGSNLNADQKAGLASLPGLEAAAKELEDLASGLEAIAKEESAKDEAARLAAESDLRNAAESAVNAYKETCLPLLTALVRVHATLRPSSSPSSNFMASDLPVELQSLSRPDVDVVDELFGLLKKGDAQAVIERIQLLKPTPIGKVLHRGDASTADSSGSTPVFSPRPLATISLPTEGSYAVPDVVQNDNELDSFRFQPEVAEQPVGRNIQPTKPAQPEMSFIQSSELVEGEVVNRNPPVEEPPVTKVEERVEPPSVPENKTTHEKKASHSQPNIAKIVGLNWADDDEDHSGEEELARIRAQFNMPPLASASSDTARDKPSIAAGGPAPLPALAATKSSSPLPTSETPMIAQSHARTVQPPPEIPPQSNKSRSNARSASGASTNISQQCQNNAPTIGRGRGRGGFHQAGKPHIKPAEPEPAMEDDGFQIATRRRGPPVHQARGTIHNGRGGNRGSMANRQNGPQRRQG